MRRLIGVMLLTASISLCLGSKKAHAQQTQKYTLSGRVKDKAKGEDFIGAALWVKELRIGTTTNAYGFYSLTIPVGNYTLVVSYLGYKAQEIPLNMSKNEKLDFLLEEDVLVKEEVVVTANKAEGAVNNTKMSVTSLDIKQIKSVPALFGEVDVMRVMQYQPGVLSAGEGTTALYVRGGGADQNLVLIDEAPVYNPAHLLGMFSTFNSDAIKTAELYKGAIPARFGGRLSAVMDIRSRDGNNQKLSGTASIGLLATRASLEGPIQKGKSSFLVTARRTYADLFLRASSDPAINSNVLYFYDINAKLNFQLGEKDRLFVAGYIGQDVFRNGDFELFWGNMTGSVRWNHIFSNKLFSNTTFVASNFNYGLGALSESTAFRNTSSLKEFGLKEDLNYYVNPKLALSFGGSLTLRDFQPGKVKPMSSRSVFRDYQVDYLRQGEAAAYISADHKISERLQLEYGLRYTRVAQLGAPTAVYGYAGRPNVDNTNDTSQYKLNEVIATYGGLEPRISARYLINEKTSIKSFYNRTYQFVNLMSNSTSPLPTQTWIPSTKHIRPQYADQVGTGIFQNLGGGMYEVSVEGFYKWMYDVADFKDNANLFLNKQVETDVSQGKGWSYGLELAVRKNEGPLTGWISYTWSKAERQVPGVNDGFIYRADYDRRHAFNAVASYQLTDNWSLGAAWTYSTGRPFTLPAANAQYDYVNFPVFSERNGYVMPAFHRLDLSATWKRFKPGRKWQGEWNFSVYNAYNRKNPFTVYSRDKIVDGKTLLGQKEVVMIWLFPALPSVAYTFSF